MSSANPNPRVCVFHEELGKAVDTRLPPCSIREPLPPPLVSTEVASNSKVSSIWAVLGGLPAGEPEAFPPLPGESSAALATWLLLRRPGTALLPGTEPCSSSSSPQPPDEAVLDLRETAAPDPTPPARGLPPLLPPAVEAAVEPTVDGSPLPRQDSPNFAASSAMCLVLRCPSST